MSQNTQNQPIVFFDGVCNLCNHAIQFIIRHDQKKLFLFSPLQSAAGGAALQNLKSPLAPDSIILFYDGRYFTRSAAALRIISLLGGGWRMFYAFMIVPRFLRDGVYSFVARHRYHWFGKKDQCMIPTPELSARFLK